VNHFKIDFRYLNNIIKIRSDLKDSQVVKVKKTSPYYILYLVNRIAKKYGDDFKKYDSLRAFIDYQFYTHTRPFLKKQCMYFVLTFILPLAF
jgi:hypothetical protein